MARRRMGKGVGPKRPLKLRVPRKVATKVKPAGVLESYPVICSGCSEEFQLKPKENGADLVCPMCDHTSEAPGKAFLDQMSRYTLRERNLFLRSAIPISVGLLLVLIWVAVLSGRSTIPRTGLVADISPQATEIPVASTDGFPSSGTLIIGYSAQVGERIAYEGIEEGKFTGAVREATDSMQPKAHTVGTGVFSKSYRVNTKIIGIVFVLAILGLLGYGVVKGFAYEKSRWVAYF